MPNLTLGATIPIGPTISARLQDLLTKNNDSDSLPTVEDYLSQENPQPLTGKFSGALGSSRAGQPLTTVPCANLKRQVPGSGPFVQCMSPGTLVCSQCLLVKYCSAECQKQHWKKHRKETCQSPLLDSDDASPWVPAWFKEKRQPQFVGEQPESPVPRHLITNYNITLWGETPPVDLLNLGGNEDAVGRGYKICFARNQGGDLRNLVHTVNSLPEDFTGTLDILYHDQKTIQAGHTLLVLYALLNDELPIDEAAEFAVHLMYSAALTTPMAAYLYRCIHTIYGAFEGLGDGDPFDGSKHKGKTYDAELPIRGGRTLEAVHEAWMLGLFLEQYVSDYKLKTAQRKMSKVMQNPKREDFAERFMVPLEGQHRVGITHFRKSGILLPFNVDAAHFDQPNRLMHGDRGEWFARHVAHPLSGWPVSNVRQSGLAHGALPTDIWGCFFFHVKSQFQEFARRVQKFNINITVATLPRDATPQRIRDGKFGAFQGGGCFDRIDMGLIVDPHLRINDTLKLWIPLLNKENPHAAMLMQINELAFHAETAAPNLSDLMVTCSKALNLDLRRIGREGQTSPSLYRIMESVDAFHDNSDAFKTYLRGLGVERTAAALGVRARDVHRIHPQRHGVPVGSPEHTIPKLSSAEFYDLFTLGSADPATRYVEFGVVVKA